MGLSNMQVGIDDGNGNIIYNPRRYLEQLREADRQRQIALLRAEAERLAEEARRASNWAAFLGHAAEFWDGLFQFATPSYSWTILGLRKMGLINESEYQQFSQPSKYRRAGKWCGLIVSFWLPTKVVGTRNVMWIPGQMMATQALSNPAVAASIQILLPLGKVITITHGNAFSAITGILKFAGNQANERL